MYIGFADIGHICQYISTSALTPDGGLINGVGALSVGIYHLFM